MLEADRDLFARLLVVAQTREMDLREVFKYFLWLAKCCINLYLCSTKYIFIQQLIVIFNILYLCSTMRIIFSYSTKLFSFNNNIYSTSIAILILLDKINCSTSVQTFYSTKIIIQLLPCIFYDEVFKSSWTFEILLFNKFPVPSPVKHAA